MATPKSSNKPRDEEEFRTRSGIPVKEVYTPSDLKDWDYGEQLSSPGEYPFTRGINAASQRVQWLIGQYFGFGTGKSTNEFLKYVITQGAQQLVIAFDLPTQCGYDSNHTMAHGEVGRIGVAIDSLQDVRSIFEGIPLEGKRISPGGNNATGPIVLAWMLALCEENGVPPEKVLFTYQNDPLKEFISRGAYIFPPRQAVKFAVDVVEYCHRKGFELTKPILFCGYHLREGGASITQAMAFTLANAVAYLDELQSRGIRVNDWVGRPSVFLTGGLDFFEEIAAQRAFRRMWAKVMKERYNCQKPQHLGAFLFEYTMGSRLTAQQPLNNIVRCTIAAMAAIIGGANGLCVSSYDEALGLPSPEALRVAVRTQQIIADESGVTNTVDPLAGSYYVESLTDEIEERATALFEQVQKMGGALQAIESGFYQREITRSAHQDLKDLESGRRVVVGVNKYQVADEKHFKPMKISFAEEKRQIQRLNKLKRTRDNNQVQRSLEKVKEAAIAEVNLVDPILGAVKSYATLGEICDVLSELWGRYEQGGVI
ncbi:methylmalonyl-CoA mutase [Chloroflexota bacterium]